MTFRAAALALLTTLAVVACGPGGLSRERDESREVPSPRERYARSLADAGLHRTALGADWTAAGARVLVAPLRAPLPLAERGFFAAGEAGAVAYRVEAPVGRRVVLRVDAEADSGTRLFVELFEEARDSTASRRLVAATDSLTATLDARVERPTRWLVRIQPELLRDVRYRVTIESAPSLAFPVSDRTTRAVQSFWGVDRDGGARRHEGIDIFAPRGTPVVAAAAGVAWVGDNRLGGRVVFVRDVTRNQSLYYAHLDSQLVRSGSVVRIGDTLGLVGNTGNARTTAPHLHFGVYRRGEGAIDPFPFVDTRRPMPAPVGRDSALVGRSLRTVATAVLREGPSPSAGAAASLLAGTVLLADGAAGGGWLRVRLPDDRVGYVASRAAEPAVGAWRHTRLDVSDTIRLRPAATAPLVDVVAAARRVPVLGRFGDYALIEIDGVRGWTRSGD